MENAWCKSFWCKEPGDFQVLCNADFVTYLMVRDNPARPWHKPNGEGGNSKFLDFEVGSFSGHEMARLGRGGLGPPGKLGHLHWIVGGGRSFFGRTGFPGLHSPTPSARHTDPSADFAIIYRRRRCWPAKKTQILLILEDFQLFAPKMADSGLFGSFGV